MAEKISDRQAHQQWQEYIDNIRRETAVRHGESEAEQKKRIARLEAKAEEWFKYYFPKYSYAEPAGFHIRGTERVINNPEWYEVRMWSRELAKSTRTMMEVLFLTLTGKKRYVLLISNSEDNAERLLMPYKGNLEANQLIIHDYGVQELPGKWTSTEFTTRKGVGFRAIGAKQPPRGSRNEEIRPDVILFDDIDTDIDVRNPRLVKEKWDWIEQAAISTRSISNGLLVMFLGNRIAKDCCMSRAAEKADNKDDMQVNIRDEQGNSTWPQKNSEENIDRVLSKISYATAQKEYFNNPISEGSVFKEMAYKPARPLNEYSMLVCYTDPSFKDAKTNDFKGTVLVGKWRDEYHVLKCYLEQTTTAKMIDWHYDIMSYCGERSVYYLMEQVFLSEILLQEFYAAAATSRKTPIPIVGDQRKKDNKFVRIESLLEPLNRMGKLYLNEDEQSSPHMQRLEEQFLAIGPGSRAHDDGPDAVEGAVWIINNKSTMLDDDSFYVGKKPVNSKRY